MSALYQHQKQWPPTSIILPHVLSFRSNSDTPILLTTVGCHSDSACLDFMPLCCPHVYMDVSLFGILTLMDSLSSSMDTLHPAASSGSTPMLPLVDECSPHSFGFNTPHAHSCSSSPIQILAPPLCATVPQAPLYPT